MTSVGESLYSQFDLNTFFDVYIVGGAKLSHYVGTFFVHTLYVFFIFNTLLNKAKVFIEKKGKIVYLCGNFIEKSKIMYLCGNFIEKKSKIMYLCGNGVPESWQVACGPELGM
jgi:hypothetical protein